MSGRALASAAGGGALAAALATGWVGAVLLIALVLVPTLAVCWVIADPDRPHRLAVLLTAWRHDPPLSAPENEARCQLVTRSAYARDAIEVFHRCGGLARSALGSRIALQASWGAVANFPGSVTGVALRSLGDR